MEDETGIGAAALVGGVVIGRNWGKIKRFGGRMAKKISTSKAFKNTNRFLLVQKEQIQDLLAERKMMRSAKKMPAKKTGGKKGGAKR